MPLLAVGETEGVSDRRQGQVDDLSVYVVHGPGDEEQDRGGSSGSVHGCPPAGRSRRLAETLHRPPFSAPVSQESGTRAHSLPENRQVLPVGTDRMRRVHPTDTAHRHPPRPGPPASPTTTSRELSLRSAWNARGPTN